jgi:N-acyl-D-amino-acid deacylase
VADRATTTTPHLVSEGIESVWVNGVVVYEGGKATGRRPGRVIRRRD